METKRNIRTAGAGLFVALGLLALGLTLRSAIIDFKSTERVVSVKGLSEKEVDADKVIWPLMYKEIGNDLSAIYQQLEVKQSKIIEFLKTNGLTDEEISLTAPEIIDLQAERYQSDRTPYRYNVTAVITVTSNQVERVRNLILRQTDLLKHDIAITSGDYRYSTQYLFTKLNEVKPTMIEEATKNAREAANKFAHDSGSDLGKIKTAYQGQFSINDRDANTPHIKTVRVVTTIEYYLKD